MARIATAGENFGRAQRRYSEPEIWFVLPGYLINVDIAGLWLFQLFGGFLDINQSHGTFIFTNPAYQYPPLEFWRVGHFTSHHSNLLVDVEFCQLTTSCISVSMIRLINGIYCKQRSFQIRELVRIRFGDKFA